MNLQETYRTTINLTQKYPCHVIIKTQNIQNKERIFIAAKEKVQVTYKVRPESLKILDSWTAYKTLRVHGCKPGLIY